MAEHTLAEFQKSFTADTEEQRALKREMDLYDKAKSKTRDVIAKDALYDRRLGMYERRLTLHTFERYEDRLEEKDAKIGYLEAVNAKYVEHDGELEPALLEELRQMHRPIALPQTKKHKNILNELL